MKINKYSERGGNSVPRVPVLTIIFKKSLLLSHIHVKCVLWHFIVITLFNPKYCDFLSYNIVTLCDMSYNFLSVYPNWYYCLYGTLLICVLTTTLFVIYFWRWYKDKLSNNFSFISGIFTKESYSPEQSTHIILKADVTPSLRVLL